MLPGAYCPSSSNVEIELTRDVTGTLPEVFVGGMPDGNAMGSADVAAVAVASRPLPCGSANGAPQSGHFAGLPLTSEEQETQRAILRSF
ncbi:hypothetical protein F183_A33950 [Bryobacterales bacterium F-183]|nr:hypothetical protein F183_A33950 [Bryobacterales bacterium F-183]